MNNRINPETLLYYAILGTLALSMTGLPSIRYAVYLLPVIAIVLWVAKGEFKFYFRPETIPFIALVMLMLLTSPQAGETGLKRLYFISAYTSIFVLFDMRHARVNHFFLSTFLLLLFLLSLFVTKDIHAFSNLEISILDSKSEAESTFSFVFGILAVYFLLSHKYFLAIANAVLSVIALKRIVLLGLVVVLLALILPRRLTRLLLSPAVVSVAFLASVGLCVMFAQGAFDDSIKHYFNYSSNALSMGRQGLWALAIKVSGYEPTDYLLWGSGVGNIQAAIQEHYGVTRGGLLHNDLLTLVLEQGWIATFAFIYLLARQPGHGARIFALFLLVLFLTDNVIIYQHVMIMFLLLVSRLDYEPPQIEERVNSPQKRFPNLIVANSSE